MQMLVRFFHVLLLSSLILVLFKPLLVTEVDKPLPQGVQYTLSHDCSSRTSVASPSCSSANAYFLQEEQSGLFLFPFLFLGLLFFAQVQFNYRTPIDSIDKPPICS